MPSPFDQMPVSPFARLRTLLADIPYDGPYDGGDRQVTNLVIGEPRHVPPQFVLDILSKEQASYGRYPPIPGLPEFRAACANWLARRFNLSVALYAEDHQILPVNGTREALFLIAQLAPQSDAPSGDKTLMAMPNPFYPVYAAAALAAGAEPIYLNATAETGFLPNLDALTPDTLSKLRTLFMCSPANPQGAVADIAYLDKLLQLAEQYGFWVVMDECYADIYDRALEDAPPASALNAAALRPEGLKNLIVFHSLSKRSSLPGLRSGFCVGGSEIMQSFLRLRMIAAPQTPIAVQKAAAAAWNDDAHAAENRRLYQEKNDIAEELLGHHFGFFRPQGGFFLWLNLGDGETAARVLWQKAGIRVLPGRYLSHDTEEENPGHAYIRVALVENVEKTKAALTQMRDILIQEGFK